MSWTAEVKVVNDDKWYGNDLRFETEEEAVKYAVDLGLRWNAVIDTHVIYSDKPVNYDFKNNRPISRGVD
jgi:hypothetical protein